MYSTAYYGLLILLIPTAYLGTVGLPKGTVYLVHERVHSINTHLACAQAKDGEAEIIDESEER
jgi:hypothetical protein